MGDGDTQSVTILTAPTLLGPYTVVRSWYHPLGMNAGDFDIAVGEHDRRAYYYFERVHSELVCADLTDDYTDVAGHVHPPSPIPRPPVRARGHGALHSQRRPPPDHIRNDQVLPEAVPVATATDFPWSVDGGRRPAPARPITSVVPICRCSCVFRRPQVRRPVRRSRRDHLADGRVRRPGETVQRGLRTTSRCAARGVVGRGPPPVSGPAHGSTAGLAPVALRRRHGRDRLVRPLACRGSPPYAWLRTRAPRSSVRPTNARSSRREPGGPVEADHLAVQIRVPDDRLDEPGVLLRPTQSLREHDVFDQRRLHDGRCDPRCEHRAGRDGAHPHADGREVAVP